MNITTPDKMSSGISNVEKSVAEFETQFLKETLDKDYYHLVIAGELNRESCDAIESLYYKAGWRVVHCKTSSEKNESPGLTGLQLWK